MIPQELSRFFWEVDCRKLEESRHGSYIIERILERGDPEAIHWLMEHFSREEIIQVLKTSRSLSPRSGNFWALYFGCDPKELPCMKKYWPHRPPSVSAI